MAEPLAKSICENCVALSSRWEQLQREFEAFRRSSTATISRLQSEVERLQRLSKRPAAPFRKQEEPSGVAKKPGRKKGKRYGRQAHRAIPDKIDETIPVPLPDVCPHCDGESLVETHVVSQYQTDIPQVPIVRQFDVSIGHCGSCEKSVQGRHPLQTSTAVGAAGSQFGPNLHAALATMNKELGLSLGKCAKLLSRLFHGLNIARATVYRSMARTAMKLTLAYEKLRRDVKASPMVSPDETGMRIGGRSGWLHAFVGHGSKRQATVYEIVPTRSSEPIRNLLGPDWSGWLIRDGWSPYNALTHAKQQMCLQHIQRRCQGLLETAKGIATRLPLAVLDRIDRAFAIRRTWRGRRLDKIGRVEAGAKLLDEWHETISGTFPFDPNRKLANHLLDHSPLDWFGFLLDPNVPATNYLSEQAIRPAVVNRKVWGGNRTQNGANVQGVLMSVIRSCIQRLIEPFAFLKKAIGSPKPILVPVGR